MESYVSIALAVLGLMLFYAAWNRIGTALKGLSEAYQRRTVWLAEHAATRAREAAEKKKEKAEERERHYWQALWDRLQQLQTEYITLEWQGLEGVENVERRQHAQRLAARIALIWIEFLWLKEEFTNDLQGYPLRGDKENEHQLTIILDYIERYTTAAGVTFPVDLIRNEYCWVTTVAKALDQRLRDLNTPVNTPASTP